MRQRDSHSVVRQIDSGLICMLQTCLVDVMKVQLIQWVVMSECDS